MCLKSINDQCISFAKGREITTYMTGTGCVGFAMGLVNSVFNFSAQLACEVFLSSKSFFGLVK